MSSASELAGLNVADFMERRYSSVYEDDPAQKAVTTVASDPDHFVLVLGHDDHLKGVITASDLVKLQSPTEQKAIDLATKDNLVAVLQEANLGQVVRIMDRENKRQESLDNVPVVADRSGRVVGVVNRASLDQKLRNTMRVAKAAAF